MHESRSTNIAISRFEELVSHELRIRGYSANVASILDELVQRSGLFRVLGEQIEFRHHLLQEFFAGRGISSVNFIKQVVIDEWWKRAIVFYFGENPGDVQSLREVLELQRASEESRAGRLRGDHYDWIGTPSLLFI